MGEEVEDRIREVEAQVLHRGSTNKTNQEDLKWEGDVVKSYIYKKNII